MNVLDPNRVFIGGFYYWPGESTYHFYCPSCWKATGWRNTWMKDEGIHKIFVVYADQFEDYRARCGGGYDGCTQYVGSGDTFIGDNGKYNFKYIAPEEICKKMKQRNSRRPSGS